MNTYTLIAINEGIYGKDKRVPRNHYLQNWLMKIPHPEIMRFVEQILETSLY